MASERLSRLQKTILEQVYSQTLVNENVRHKKLIDDVKKTEGCSSNSFSQSLKNLSKKSLVELQTGKRKIVSIRITAKGAGFLKGKSKYRIRKINDADKCFLKEVDGMAITEVHAKHLLNMDRSRRLFKKKLSSNERDKIIQKIIIWLKDEYKKGGKSVSIDALQAKIRNTLVEDLKIELPNLTDIPWASIWWPEKRVEAMRHNIENGAGLGTYKGAINRLIRTSSFSMSVSFNLIQLLSRKITASRKGKVQTFKKLVVVDPFMGMGIRIVTAKLLGHKSYGYDISRPTLKKVKRLWPEFKDSFFLGDARKLRHKENSVDLVFTSPPYWNLEKYEGRQGQLSRIKNYGKFLKELFKALDETFRIVKVGGYIVLVVGNFRDRNGKYYPFAETIGNYMVKIGLEYWDKIILAHNITRPMGGIASIEKNHTRVAHEEMLIFNKPAPPRAAR